MAATTSSLAVSLLATSSYGAISGLSTSTRTRKAVEEERTDKKDSGEEQKSPAITEDSKKAKYLQIVNIALMALVLTGFGMCGSLFTPFFPTEAARRGVSSTVVGFIFSSFTLVMFLGSFASGRLVRKLGLHFMIGCGTLLAGGTTILFGLLDQAPPGYSYVVLCFCVRLTEGLGASLYITAAYSTVASINPKNIATSFAILQASNGVGRMIGPGLGGVLYTAGGFSLPFYVVGSMLLIFGFVSQIALRWSMPANAGNTLEKGSSSEKGGKKDASPPLPWSHFYRVSFDIWMLTFLLPSTSILLGFSQPTLSLYFQELGLTDATLIGLIFFLTSFTYLVSALAVGKIADSHPTILYKNMIFAYFLNTFAYFIAGPPPFTSSFLPQSIYLTSSGCLLSAAALAAILCTAPKAILEAAHKAGYKDGLDTSAMVSSLYNGMWFLGQFAGAPIAGSLMDSVGFQWGAFIMSVTSLCMALIVVTREILYKAGIIRFQLQNYEQLPASDAKV